jgi:hypothetical protein
VRTQAVHPTRSHVPCGASASAFNAFHALAKSGIALHSLHSRAVLAVHVCHPCPQLDASTSLLNSLTGSTVVSSVQATCRHCTSCAPDTGRCTVCVTGYYLDAAGTCDTCANGYGQVSAGGICLQCEAGTWQCSSRIKLHRDTRGADK